MALIKKLLATATAVAGCGVIVLAGQTPSPPAVYTTAQAEAGKTAYQSSCMACHTDTLIPAAGAKYMGQEIPPLAGANFMAKWGPQTTSDLSSRIKVAIGGFPPKNLTEKTYLELAAYVLQVSGAQAGTQELTAATAVVIETATVAREANSDRR
jgi:polar amino acid transport system substrate-binding protein